MTDAFDDREHCATCYFSDHGDCHRNPPTAFPMPTINRITGEEQVTKLAIWPPAPEGGWCGEFKRKGVQ